MRATDTPAEKLKDGCPAAWRGPRVTSHARLAPDSAPGGVLTQTVSCSVSSGGPVSGVATGAAPPGTPRALRGTGPRLDFYDERCVSGRFSTSAYVEGGLPRPFVSVPGCFLVVTWLVQNLTLPLLLVLPKNLNEGSFKSHFCNNCHPCNSSDRHSNFMKHLHIVKVPQGHFHFFLFFFVCCFFVCFLVYEI